MVGKHPTPAPCGAGRVRRYRGSGGLPPALRGEALACRCREEPVDALLDLGSRAAKTGEAGLDESVRIRATERRRIEQFERNRRGSGTLFLFKTAPALGDFRKAPAPSPDVLTKPWQRAGHEAFVICR
jgi:hypothetical protein